MTDFICHSLVLEKKKSLNASVHLQDEAVGTMLFPVLHLFSWRKSGTGVCLHSPHSSSVHECSFSLMSFLYVT